MLPPLSVAMSSAYISTVVPGTGRSSAARSAEDGEQSRAFYSEDGEPDSGGKRSHPAARLLHTDEPAPQRGFLLLFLRAAVSRRCRHAAQGQCLVGTSYGDKLVFF